MNVICKCFDSLLDTVSLLETVSFRRTDIVRLENYVTNYLPTYSIGIRTEGNRTGSGVIEPSGPRLTIQQSSRFCDSRGRYQHQQSVVERPVRWDYANAARGTARVLVKCSYSSTRKQSSTVLMRSAS